ncbi:MAG: glucosyltransferase domain-containing protein [Flavobacteriaceae bacterium]|jgi:hypothetical protein|nr:glucosyltransferase domain-containing protein [Flavobacteriaceae bacterium]
MTISLFLHHKKSIFFNLCFSLLFVLPLLLANVPYEDDLNRDLHGYDLNGNSRFIGSLFMRIFSFNLNYSFSWFPFSSILIFSLFGFSGLLMSNLLHIEKETNIKLSSVIILCSPFLLHNLSYRYDVNMPLSLIVLIIPFFFTNRKYIFLCLSILSVYLSLGLYQATTFSYFLIGTLYLLYIKKNNIKFNYSRFLFLSFLSFIIACLLYKLSLLILDMDITYNNTEIIFFKNDFFLLLKNNIVYYLNSLSPIVNTKYLLALFFFIILSIISLIRFISLSKNYALLILLACSCLVAFFLIGGINLLLYPAIFVPRTLIGYSLILYIPAIFLNDIKNYTLKYLSYSIIIIYSLLAISNYGKILANHEKYLVYIENIIDSNFKNQNPQTKRIIIGEINVPINHLIYKSFPIIRELKPSNWYNHIRLNDYYGYKKPDNEEIIRFYNKDEQEKFDTKWENPSITIKGNDNYILIINKN